MQNILQSSTFSHLKWALFHSHHLTVSIVFIWSDAAATIFSLKYQTGKNYSKWECPENFRELFIIKPKCPVWNREIYSAIFHCELPCPIIATFCVCRSGPTYWGSPFEVVKCSDCSHIGLIVKMRDVSTPISRITTLTTEVQWYLGFLNIVVAPCYQRKTTHTTHSR